MSSFHALDRRDFLHFASSAFAGAAVASHGLNAIAADERPALIIDCHAHIYGEDETKYPIIVKPYRPPEGKGTIKHLRSEMRTNGVRYVTAVQTSTYYGFDNRFTSDSSRDNADIMVGICTLNADDKMSVGMLEQYVKQKNVRGMRSIPAPTSSRFDDPGVDALWAMAEQLGIVINVLANRDQRAEIEALIKRHPKLRVVIDHCLNLRAGPTLEPTMHDLIALSNYPTVHAKLSFIPTGSAEGYPCRDMHEPCRRVIQAFGADRCVWGSDFPCELWCKGSSEEPVHKTSYAQHLAIFTHELGLSELEKKGILGETAKRLWFEPAVRAERQK